MSDSELPDGFVKITLTQGACGGNVNTSPPGYAVEKMEKAETECQKMQAEEAARVAQAAQAYQAYQESVYMQNPAERYLREQIGKPVPTIKDAFGSTESIDSRVAAYDFSSIMSSDKPGFHAGLAPAYGQLTTGSFQQMDDNLKIMSGASMRIICSIPPDFRKFGVIVDAFGGNPLFKVHDDPPMIERKDSFRKSGNTAFKDGGIDQGVVNEVKSWFIGLIKDDNVIKDTKIDINVLGKIVAQTGASVTSFETVFHAEAHRRKTVIDIGVMRFPDIDKPFIQIYLITLTAWSDSVRDLFFESDSSGIIGDYHSIKFVPNDALIGELSASVHKQAKEDGEKIFED